MRWIGEKVPDGGGFGQCPSKKWISLLHKRGFKVIYRLNHNTIVDTEKALSAGVDVIGATGYEAGGEPTYIGLTEIVPVKADLVNGRVPLFAVGGIADKRQVKAAFDLGAQGVYVGSAFINSQESAISENIKELAI